MKYHIILLLCSLNTHKVSWNMWNLLSFGALMECVIIKNPALMMFEKLVVSFKDIDIIRKTWICYLFCKECRNLDVRLPGNWILYSGTLCLWLLSMALVSCHPSGFLVFWGPSRVFGKYMELPYFRAHKMHRDFFVRNFRKK